MRHRLRRPDGATILVDADLWLCLLDLALQEGWRPKGTKDPDARLRRESSHTIAWEPLAYFLPLGQSIDAKDARAIARTSAAALAAVPETEVPLQDKPFGDENTLEILRLAAAREPVPRSRTEAASELLSGAPKQQATALIDFLQHGHVTIRPEAEQG